MLQYIIYYQQLNATTEVSLSAVLKLPGYCRRELNESIIISLTSEPDARIGMLTCLVCDSESICYARTASLSRIVRCAPWD